MVIMIYTYTTYTDMVTLSSYKKHVLSWVCIYTSGYVYVYIYI